MTYTRKNKKSLKKRKFSVKNLKGGSLNSFEKRSLIELYKNHLFENGTIKYNKDPLDSNAYVLDSKGNREFDSNKLTKFKQDDYDNYKKFELYLTKLDVNKRKQFESEINNPRMVTSKPSPAISSTATAKSTAKSTSVGKNLDKIIKKNFKPIQNPQLQRAYDHLKVVDTIKEIESWRNKWEAIIESNYLNYIHDDRSIIAYAVRYKTARINGNAYLVKKQLSN